MNNENKVLGTVGAFLGAALGIAVWCLLGRIGIIAALGGYVICMLTFGGYMVLGKDVSKYGIILSIIIVLASVYIATRLNWAITLQNAFDEELGYDLSLWDSFKNIMDYVKLAGVTNKFYLDLYAGYGLTVLGGISFFLKVAPLYG